MHLRTQLRSARSLQLLAPMRRVISRRPMSGADAGGGDRRQREAGRRRLCPKVATVPRDCVGVKHNHAVQQRRVALIDMPQPAQHGVCCRRGGRAAAVRPVIGPDVRLRRGTAGARCVTAIVWRSCRSRSARGRSPHGSAASSRSPALPMRRNLGIPARGVLRVNTLAPRDARERPLQCRPNCRSTASPKGHAPRPKW